MLRNYDVRFQNTIASDLPSFLVNPTEEIEDTASARAALADLRGTSDHGIGAQAAAEPQAQPEHAPGASAERLDLPDLGTAPEFVGNQEWFNTPGDKPLTLKGLRGRVVLVDFWTYTCINCIRTLPYLTAWDKRYRKDGLTIVGVHTPEFPFERSAANVEMSIRENGIHYPVVQDNDQATWNAYANQYWPAEYFIDAKGEVRYVHFGEGEYAREREGDPRPARGSRPPGRQGRVGGQRARTLGRGDDAGDLPRRRPRRTLRQRRRRSLARAARLQRARPRCRRTNSPSAAPGGSPPRRRPPPAPAAGSTSTSAPAASSSCSARPGDPRRVRVRLDGKPIGAGAAGADVHGGVVTVRSQRLYSLVDLPRVESHVLELEPEKGVSGYAFTFG